MPPGFSYLPHLLNLTGIAEGDRVHHDPLRMGLGCGLDRIAPALVAMLRLVVKAVLSVAAAVRQAIESVHVCPANSASTAKFPHSISAHSKDG